MPRIFLLSPANLGGRRAEILLRPEAAFPLALRLRSREGVPIGEVYSFLSGLYFRGKLAYARAFGEREQGAATFVITPGRGLVEPDRPVRRRDLLRIATVPVAVEERRYRVPLMRDARRLAQQLPEASEVVLLGSIATDKYAAILRRVFPDLRFPSAFVGRGDMSRGGLLLRCVTEGRRLETRTIDGAQRRGSRPPRLEPLRRAAIAVSEA